MMAGKKKADEVVWARDAHKQTAKAAAKQTREKFFSGEKTRMQAKMDEIVAEFAAAERFKAGARRLRLLTLELTKMMKEFRDASMRVDEAAGAMKAGAKAGAKAGVKK